MKNKGRRKDRVWRFAKYKGDIVLYAKCSCGLHYPCYKRVTRKGEAMSAIGFCKTCNAKIRWIPMRSGRMMPVNPEAVRFSFPGKEVFVTDSGVVVHGKRDDKGDLKGYTSHFATCPGADRHRRKK